LYVHQLVRQRAAEREAILTSRIDYMVS
jgi:hypothetical protein